MEGPAVGAPRTRDQTDGALRSTAFVPSGRETRAQAGPVAPAAGTTRGRAGHHGAAALWSLWRSAGREGPALSMLKDLALHAAALAARAGRSGALTARADQPAGFTRAPEPVVLATGPRQRRLW